MLSETSTADESGGRNFEVLSYLPMGQPLQLHDGLVETTTEYDELNRPISIRIDPGQNQPVVSRQITYDLHGNSEQLVISGSCGLTRTYGREYDPADRLCVETLNGPPYSAREYLAGTVLVQRLTDWHDAVTHYDYDAKHHLDQITQPTGHVIDVDYDVAGNKIAEVDGNGHRTRFS